MQLCDRTDSGRITHHSSALIRFQLRHRVVNLKWLQRLQRQSNRRTGRQQTHCPAFGESAAPPSGEWKPRPMILIRSSSPSGHFEFPGSKHQSRSFTSGIPSRICPSDFRVFEDSHEASGLKEESIWPQLARRNQYSNARK